MKKYVRFPKISVFLLLFLLLFIIGCNEQDADQNPGNGVNLSFTDFSGETRQLSEFYGTVIVVDLMAVNCQPCFYQILELQKVAENYSAEQVSIISIDVWVSYGETASLLQEYLDYIKNELGITLDWTFGLDDEQGTINNKYASEGVPTIVLFDQNGNVYYTHTGYEEYGELSTKINELLES